MGRCPVCHETNTRRDDQDLVVFSCGFMARKIGKYRRWEHGCRRATGEVLSLRRQIAKPEKGKRK